MHCMLNISRVPEKVPSSILAATNFFIFSFLLFSFSSTFFFCIIFDFFNEKAPFISNFLKKRKTTIRGGPLTFEGGGGGLWKI